MRTKIMKGPAQRTNDQPTSPTRLRTAAITRKAHGNASEPLGLTQTETASTSFSTSCLSTVASPSAWLKTTQPSSSGGLSGPPFSPRLLARGAEGHPVPPKLDSLAGANRGKGRIHGCCFSVAASRSPSRHFSGRRARKNAPRKGQPLPRFAPQKFGLHGRNGGGMGRERPPLVFASAQPFCRTIFV